MIKWFTKMTLGSICQMNCDSGLNFGSSSLKSRNEAHTEETNFISSRHPHTEWEALTIIYLYHASRVDWISRSALTVAL